MLKLRTCAALILLAGLPALTSAPYVDVKPAGYQSVIDGKQTDLYTLKNRQGMVVKISNYGGKIVELLVPDRNGNLGDVVMGFDTI
ncbi:hypothetical protein HDG33_007379 [Paraburkholderia sp. Cpub6]|nr:hypothetical protein [Paraburkholderia sp. Cpub6]